MLFRLVNEFYRYKKNNKKQMHFFASIPSRYTFVRVAFSLRSEIRYFFVYKLLPVITYACTTTTTTDRWYLLNKCTPFLFCQLSTCGQEF